MSPLALTMLALLAACLALAGCATTTASSAPLPTILTRRIEIDGRAYPYAVILPAGHDNQERWPAILFLHGRGESGINATRPLTIGLPRTVLYAPDEWPCVVIVPQKPTPDGQWDAHTGAVLAILDRCLAEHRIDPDRVVLTGMSMGGHGCWTIHAAAPHRFAALAPVCGYAFPWTSGPDGEYRWSFDERSPELAQLAAAASRVPVWAWHGSADSVVPVQQTTGMIDAIRRAGADPEPRMTIVPGVDHNSWDNAYADPELRAWLLSQRRR